jgi:hypothetical protein
MAAITLALLVGVWNVASPSTMLSIGGAFTAKRYPVKLVFAEHFATITDAIEMERRIKGWSRAKKEALINGNWKRVQTLAHRRGPHPSRRASRSSG